MFIPEWIPTALTEPIARVGVPVIGFSENYSFVAGTACIIAPGLAITASHVIEDCFNRIDGQPPKTGETSKANIVTFTAGEPGHPYVPLRVHRAFYTDVTDIALLFLTPSSAKFSAFEWPRPHLRLLPPRVGSNIRAFGYPKSKIEIVDARNHIKLAGRVTTGIVQEIHHRQRDAGMLKFPCYRTNARFEGGMSGGPVLDDSGAICGLVVAGLPPDAPDVEHYSHALTLWPMLSIVLDLPRQGYAKQARYPLFDLASLGGLKTGGLECVRTQAAPNGAWAVSCTYVFSELDTPLS
jgi:hypothetical protein